MRRTLRVVIASRLFPPEPGAAAYRLGALAKGLAQQHVQVRVLTTTPPPSARHRPWRHSHVAVSRWPVLRDSGGNVRGYVQFASFDGPLLFRLLFGPRADAVVAEPPPTTGVSVRIACALRRVPYVYYAGDVSSVAAAGVGVSPRVIPLLRRVEAWAMSGAARVLAVSDGVARSVAELGVSPQRITVVGTGVDTEAFRPPPQVDSENPTFVYAGTMSGLQGVEVFIRAFAQIAGDFPRARLLMLGQGTERRELERLGRSLAPGRIEFEGLVGAERVVEALGSAWAGLASVKPGHAYDFSFPTKMFVSTACGTPVIYAGVGPGRTIVAENELGWAVDWNPDLVAEAMRQALRRGQPGQDRRARMVEWTRQHASQAVVARKAAEAIASVTRLESVAAAD